MKIEKLQNPYVRGNEGCSVSMIDLLEKINEIIDAMNGEHDPADIYSEDGRLIAKKDESEDERIRQKLMWLLQQDICPFPEEEVTQMLNYLEKQKEQKPASTEDMPYVADEHFFEREPADSFKYKLAEYMTKNCTKKEGPYGYTYGISAESILQMAKEELIKRGELKEQKPVEKQDYSGLTDLERAIHRGFLCAGVENVPVGIIKETVQDCLAQMKPAEWSDYKDKIDIPYCSSEQEWSEEDADILNCCISSIEEAKENRYAYKETDGDTSYDHEIDWLKSLRPSWKPSKEQIYSLGTVVKGYVECSVGSVGYNLKTLYTDLQTKL